MKLANAEKIRRYRQSGHWGSATIDDLFQQAVAEHTQQEALLDPLNRPAIDGQTPRRLSMAATALLVDAYARQLAQWGLTRGQVVVVQAPNIVELVAVYLAGARLGLIISPLPVQYAAHELKLVFATLNPAAFIGATAARLGDPLEVAAPLLPESALLITLNHSEHPGALLIRTSLADTDVPRLAATSVVDADDCFTVCWTSGTTGQPKGVPRSHNHWLAQGPAMHHGLGMTCGDRLLSPFPFTNMAAIGGTLLGWLLNRGTLILHHPFDLGVLLAQVAQEQPNVLLLPPPVLNMLLKKPELAAAADWTGVMSIGSGSAPLAPWMVAQWQERGVKVVNIFGSNEGAAFVTSYADVQDPHLRAVCFPRFGQGTGPWANPISEVIESKLVSGVGAVLDQPGQVGELYIRGANVFEGYWGLSQAEHREQGLFDEAGYFRSGDLFEIDPEDPRLMRFVARSKEIIVRGGVNISMQELDGLLAEFPGVAEVATFVVPDQIMGERVGVAVVPADLENPPGLDDLAAFLKSKGVAVFKHPEVLLQVAQLPRNPMSKVLRHELTQLAVADRPPAA